jgi:hypothetical protein
MVESKYICYPCRTGNHEACGSSLVCSCPDAISPEEYCKGMRLPKEVVEVLPDE